MNITIYTRAHCPSCREAIRYFRDKGLRYQELDVGMNEKNFEEMLGHGGIATPFMIVGSRKLHFFDREKIEDLLKGGE